MNWKLLIACSLMAWHCFLTTDCGDWRRFRRETQETASHRDCGVELPSPYRGPGCHLACRLHHPPVSQPPPAGESSHVQCFSQKHVVQYYNEYKFICSFMCQFVCFWLYCAELIENIFDVRGPSLKLQTISLQNTNFALTNMDDNS